MRHSALTEADEATKASIRRIYQNEHVWIIHGFRWLLEIEITVREVVDISSKPCIDITSYRQALDLIAHVDQRVRIS